MKVLEVEQGSPEWLQARCGIPTASEFHKVITPKTLKPSGQADKYIYTLLAEIQCGPQNNPTTASMDRGTLLEPEAVAWYELTQGVDVQRVGFCTLDDGTAGASTDGLVGDDGLIEIKCREGPGHMEALLDPSVDDAHKMQTQGGLWVTGRQWCDMIFYHPEMESVVRRQHRDEQYIAKIASAIRNVTTALATMRAKLGI